MAVARRSSPPYALIVFVFLWVATLAALVGTYITMSRQVKEAVADQETLKTLLSPNDRNSTEVKAWLSSAKSTDTLAGRAASEVDRLKSVIGGPDAARMPTSELTRAPSGTDQGGRVEQALAAADVKDAGSLLQAISTIQGQYASSQASAKQAQDALAAAKSDYDSSKAAAQQAIDAGNKSIADLKTQIDQLNQQVAAAQAAQTKAEQSHQGILTEAQTKAEADLRNQVVLLQQAQQQKSDLQQRVDELSSALNQYRGNNGTQPIEREPDGKVVRVDDQTVYVNLGRNDHISPGLTFAVYDPRQGIPSGPNGGGKGAIEITSVGDSESVARITHLESKANILEGDQIANPVYSRDKNRKYHFVIAGDFDLEGTGHPTNAGREKIIRLVNSWGGVVDDKITPQTDFLVMGDSPANPTVKVNASTPETDDQKATRENQQKSYDALITEARGYSIPIYNPNKFLALLGYYNTTTVQ